MKRLLNRIGSSCAAWCVAAGMIFFHHAAVPRDFSLGINAFRSGNYQEAAQVMQRLAESGYPEAQFQLGVMYLHGNGVPEDINAALDWLQRAANADYARARQVLDYVFNNDDSYGC